jgi:serine/threonine protein phosphatase PrpC
MNSLKKLIKNFTEKNKAAMKIDLVYEKGLRAINEDNYIIKDNLWGVFDGAGSLNKYITPEGKTGGLIASLIAKTCFEKNNKSLKELAIEANSAINEETEKRKIDTSDKINLWGTNLAVIKIQKNKINWLQISDASIVLIYEDNSHRLLSNNDEHDQETLLKWKELAKNKTENIVEILDEQIKAVRRKMNITYGFLTGEKEAIDFLQGGEENIEGVKHIILFTDGFVIPQPDPEVPYPWNHFINLYLENGIEGLKNHIRNLEKSDPNCWLYPRLKQYDDMTAISITL